MINSKPAPEARTTLWALNQLLDKCGQSLNIQLELKIRVPIGAGYGTSAAGTLASCVAFADALQLNLTFNEIGTITHIAEVINQTGLGTAIALMQGGFVLVEQPGAPGIGLVDRLMFPSGHSIVCGYLGPIPTSRTLGQSSISERVNPAARRVMHAIREKPDLQTFLSETRKFSAQVGFLTPEVERLMQEALAAGALGVAQNMIGHAVHAVVEDSKIPRVMKALARTSPKAKVFASKLDNRGVRLV
jgi:pantoate kinase